MLWKKLYGYLMAADCDHRSLRELGWFDLLLTDTVKSDDARIVGAVVIHHLLVDEDGRQINHDDRVVYAVLAFVESELRSGKLPSAVSSGLAVVLRKPPVTLDAVTRWFLTTFA